MAVIYNTQYVDERYVSILEPNLYYGSVLQPGVTFTDKYSVQAGGIFIHKLGGGIASGVVPGTPGRDFSDAVVADTLIQAVFNNNFQRSRKIWGVTAAAVAYDKAEAELAEAVKEVSQGWQASGLACMVEEGTDLAVTTAVADTNVKEFIISMRKALVVKGATPTFAIVSPAVFEEFLTFIGTEYTPTLNDGAIAGRAVNFLGIQMIEANALAQTDARYYNYAGALKALDLTKVDIIMGDAEAFSALNNFENVRVVDSERFSGSLAQVEMNAAYRVTNADRLLVKFNASADISI
jgi:hypothetical protein